MQKFQLVSIKGAILQYVINKGLYRGKYQIMVAQ